MLLIGRKIYALFEPHERLQALGILVLTITMAFLELIGIASVLPFIAVLSAPQHIHSNKWLSLAYNEFGFESDRHFLFFLGVIVLAFLIVSNCFKAITRWTTLRFSQMRGHSLSVRLLTQYLYQPYAFFLEHNSNYLGKNISEVQALVTNVVVPFMDLIARICVCTAILLLLLFIDPVLAIGSGVILSGAYAIIYLGLRKWLFNLGQQRLELLASKGKTTSEVLYGIKNVKLTGAENFYLHFYKNISHRLAQIGGLNGMASDLPRYALEIIAFGGILFIVLYELIKNQDIKQALPIITLYALAGYRLMPNFQGAFAALVKLRFNAGLLEHSTGELKRTMAMPEIIANVEQAEPMAFFHSIELKDVSFSYNETLSSILKNLNLTIPAFSSLGVVGKTGSGKTTLIDIILGLLSPTGGEILIDGIPLTNSTRRNWQKNIAYVTQHIYLIDDTIGKNIAFGLLVDKIDHAQVEHAAKMADIHDFIMTLPLGYETIVGENGVKFSGGQRQRIGIARALYLNRPVLVLDEATSALDVETENSVMDSINNLGGKKTIIMITHRIASLARFEHIIDLSKKSI